MLYDFYCRCDDLIVTSLCSAPTSVANVALPACAAIDQYLLLAGHTATNSQQQQANDGTDGQT